METSPQSDRIVREAERRLLTGVSRSQWHRLVKAGKAPQPVRLSARARAEPASPRFASGLRLSNQSWRRDPLARLDAAGCLRLAARRHRYSLAAMSARNAHDSMLPHGSDKCRCKACGLYFNSTFAFDQHRNGHARRDRRCRTVDELLAKGWSQSATGHWITSTRDVGAPQRVGPATAPGYV
jgi:predicted DNA-binding transcriptional regulator AlpA